MNTKRIWAGEIFWVGFGIFAAVVALLAGTRFLTHLLSTEQYGRLALAVSLSTLAVQVFGEPIGKTAVRFYSQWCQAGKPAGFLKSLAKSLAGASVLIVSLCAVVLITGAYFKSAPDSYFVVITGIFAILLVFNRVGLALEDAARKRRFRGAVQGGFEVMRFGFAVGLVTVFAIPDAETVLSGFVLAGALIVIVHAVFLYPGLAAVQNNRPGLKPKPDVMNLDTMRSFQTPLIAGNACIWVVMMAERWVLQYFATPGDVGGYAAVYQLAFVPMLFVGHFLILFFEPILYQVTRVNKKDIQSIQALRINQFASIGILCFSICLFIVLLFWHPMVGRYVLGADFRAYTWLFPWLLLAGGCFATSQQLLLKLSCEMRTDLLARLWGAVAVIAVTGYVIGACFFQLKGILATIVAVNVSLVLFLFFFLNRKSVVVNDPPLT
jgi:O-antigen/teichoic acid export membrane protein